MTKEKQTVGQTTTETTMMGSMSNEQVINFEDIKKAWMKFAEHCFYDNITDARELLPDPNEIRCFFNVERINYYLDAAKEAEKFCNAIADCDSMEDYEKIDFVGYIEDMMNSWYVPKQVVVDFAVNNCGIDEEIAEVMVNVLKGE